MKWDTGTATPTKNLEIRFTIADGMAQLEQIISIPNEAQVTPC